MNPPSFGSSRRERIPTAFSSMIPSALDLAAADIAGLTFEAKNRRRNEMLAVGFRRRLRWVPYSKNVLRWLWLLRRVGERRALLSYAVLLWLRGTSLNTKDYASPHQHQMIINENYLLNNPSLRLYII